MALFLWNLLVNLLLLISILICILLLYYYHAFQYWSRKGVPFVKPSFPFGNVTDQALKRISLSECLKNVYDELKKTNSKYGGFYVFTKPILLAMDPEFVKSVMTKDFKVFHDRGVYSNEKDDPLSAHLFTVEGEKWRFLRNKLSQAFTAGKIKQVFETFVNCGADLEEVLRESVRKAEPMNIKDVMARYSTDVIASTAFGLECHSVKNPNEELRQQGILIFTNGIKELFLQLFSLMMPSVLYFFKASVNKPEVVKYFYTIIPQIIEYREKHNIDRKDIMSLLIKLKNNQSLDDDETVAKDEVCGITMNQLMAQSFITFVGGYETSSTTMTFALLEMAQNKEIQDKVQNEIRRTLKKHDGKLTYDSLAEMRYLDNVINETLRKYPPLGLLNRMCVEDFQIPDTDIVIEKGTLVYISNHGLQMDPDYFPEPETFDPDRFSDERKAQIPAYAYLPFGEGPRNCIGKRFGHIQSKIGLVTLLKNYKFSLHPKTVMPIEFDPCNVILSHKYGVWLQPEAV